LVLCQPPPHITPDIPRSRKLIGLLKENFSCEVLKEKEKWIDARALEWIPIRRRVSTAGAKLILLRVLIRALAAHFPNMEIICCLRIDRTRLVLTVDRRLASPDLEFVSRTSSGEIQADFVHLIWRGNKMMELSNFSLHCLHHFLHIFFW